MKPVRCWLVAIVIVSLAGSAGAQWTHSETAPYLDSRTYHLLRGEISGDSAYEFERYFTQFHRPRGGAEGLMRVAEYIAEQARSFGLEEVRLIRQKANQTPWTARRGEVWMIEPELQLIASIRQSAIHLSDNSSAADLEAELIDVGAGLAESDYAQKDVAGKVVLAWGSLAAVMREAVWNRKAAGILYHPDPDAIDYPLNSVSFPDQIKWTNVPMRSSDGTPSTFAFSLTHRQGTALRNQLRAAGKPVRLRVKIEVDTSGEPWQVLVEGFIKGTAIANQDIVLTGHMQEEKFSANDDGSGCATVLEIGRALKQLIDEGRVPRPRRNIRFWWTTEISGERQHFADYPDLPRSLWVNINHDMVGADQSQDVMRVQKITRLPFSRAHFLSAMAERLTSFLVTANGSDLARLTSDAPQPAPVHSRLGKRHRYNAEVIPFHNSTDHMTFTEAPIGVPGITFTNWPDNFIHSSDDDLWNIDRTQLQRNALSAAVLAYALAAAEPAAIPALARDVVADSAVRLAKASSIATEMIASGKIDPARAANLVAQVEQEGVRSLESLGAIGASSSIAEGIGRVEALGRSLRSAWPPPTLAASGLQQELAAMKPALAGNATLFLQARNRIRGVAGLHSLMAFEVLNLVDGRRSAWDIYQVVDAEALFAGPLYYGDVSPEEVRECLKNAVEAGVVVMR